MADDKNSELITKSIDQIIKSSKANDIVGEIMRKYVAEQTRLMKLYQATLVDNRRMFDFIKHLSENGVLGEDDELEELVMQLNVSQREIIYDIDETIKDAALAAIGK